MAPRPVSFQTPGKVIISRIALLHNPVPEGQISKHKEWRLLKTRTLCRGSHCVPVSALVGSGDDVRLVHSCSRGSRTTGRRSSSLVPGNVKVDIKSGAAGNTFGHIANGILQAAVTRIQHHRSLLVGIRSLGFHPNTTQAFPCAANL